MAVEIMLTCQRIAKADKKVWELICKQNIKGKPDHYQLFGPLLHRKLRKCGRLCDNPASWYAAYQNVRKVVVLRILQIFLSTSVSLKTELVGEDFKIYAPYSGVLIKWP